MRGVVQNIGYRLSVMQAYVPRAERDRFIFCVSTSVSPSAPDSDTRSLPARSTRCIFPSRSSKAGTGTSEDWFWLGVEAEEDESGEDGMRLSTCTVRMA